MQDYNKFKDSALKEVSGGELRKLLRDFKPIGGGLWDKQEEEEEWRSSVEGNKNEEPGVSNSVLSC